jgi:membrane-bound metal-dependent hydrolase YbcI (DUF457 family)
MGPSRQEPVGNLTSIPGIGHNEGVPFTISHTAAALPFRRARLVTSALVAGTMAPDFEYFFALKTHDRVGHTFPGVLVLTLPVALLGLWIFHSFVKAPAAGLLPRRMQSKLASHLGEFRFWGPGRFAMIVFSILVGIATHLLWDSFTHADTYVCEHWSLLRRSVDVPILGPMPWYKVFQHGSTILGLVVVSFWLFRWYRESEPRRVRVAHTLSPSTRNGIVFAGISLAVAGGIIRALWGIGVPTDQIALRRFTGEAVVTCMALAWWQLVGYGVFSSKRER